MFFKISTILLASSLSGALPITERVVKELNQAATAEAQKKDTTATRAFTATEIKTSDGNCLFVDPLSGDFRENLTPIQIAPCDGSAGQKWDFITKGIHNNVAGATLVVSSLTNACANFDPRRAAGDQVNLFSCGGRADGGGQVTNSQLFKFTSGATTFTLEPLNAKGTCFTVRGTRIDQAACGAGASQTFSVGGNKVTPPAASNSVSETPTATASGSASEVSASESVCPAPTVSTVTVTVSEQPPALASTSSAPSAPAITAPSANPTTPVPVRGSGGTLNPAAAAEAHQFDATATRPLVKFNIKDSAGNCLFIDPVAGDFRQNLIPITSTPCDGSPNQQFDLITSGKHNVGQTGQALVVSSLTNGCLNFDGRRQAGDQVIIFSCGGRGDGDGGTQSAQLFAFTGNNGARTLSPKSNTNVCFVVKNGRLDNAPCQAGAADQQFTFVENGAGGGATQSPVNNGQNNGQNSQASSVVAATSTSNTAAATVTPPPTNNAPAANPTTPVPVSRAGGTLKPADAAQSHQRDNTATRAFSNVQLKSADGRCLFIDPTAGDFRQNLIPVQMKACDGSANEKFDIITSGKHNNAKGAALIVSSLMQGCLNFDDRRADGDRVIIFSCGGRADGDGNTTDSQLFPFTGAKTLALAPQNSKGAVCLAPKGNLLDAAACNNDPSQQFTIV